MNALAEHHPHDPVAWPAYRMILPHALTLLDHAPPDTDTTRTSRLLNDLGHYLKGQGDLGTAIAYYARATDSHHRLSGPDHPDTLSLRSNLAGAYESAGDLGRAIPLFEATLADAERVLGSDHPTTRTIRSNLDKARST
ncbi:hypothetical protein ALI22I_08885 [Saccharothrix sp. ALI-22-I]|uniref:tetratricopeptide repeat protein n=1 Tax=Saccharothrix sp. ALI-22-I TaxID=1933778 RepID=UPI00097C214D|nr:tetratricopeptide repeat protein [Saccharothrix sp. ALI-22-I]ONI91450.1 hypothetical protein ALI22I_08885 [Saccharothrix sp. ALI-22-I]